MRSLPLCHLLYIRSTVRHEQTLVGRCRNQGTSQRSGNAHSLLELNGFYVLEIAVSIGEWKVSS